MADKTIQELQISLPGNGNTEVYELDGDTPVKFNFDPSNAVFSGENGNLEIAVEGGGTIILENYQALADAGHLPLFEMPNGEMVAGDTYMFAFSGADQNGDLETAAGNTAGGSGAGQYSDDHGALYDGINALGGQGDAYDPHAFPTSDPVTGLLLEDTPGAVNEAPTLDLSMNTVTFVSEDARNNNMIGVYELDANGQPINPEIILLDSNATTPGQVLTTVEDGQELHYFLVVGATTASGTPTLSQDPVTGQWSISFEGDSNTYEVRFDSATLNGYDEETFRFVTTADGREVLVDDQLLEADDDDDFNDTVIRENANAGTGFDNTFYEGLGAVHIVGEANISDSDSANMSQAVITLTNAQDGDSLNVDSAALAALGITATVDSTGTVITLTGDVSIANYENALELITFNNTSDDPNTVARTIEVQVWDDAASPTGAASNVATTTIEVVASQIDAHSFEANAVAGNNASIATDTGATTVATGNLLDSYGGEVSGAVAENAIAGAWGSLTIAANGEWTYTPYDSATIDTSAIDHPTVETFTYQVIDSTTGAAETATMYIPVHIDASETTIGSGFHLGNNLNNVIYGSDNGNAILAEGGNDFVYGGANGDNLFGGSGHDYISGGGGNDNIDGGYGNDYLFGGAGNDNIQGGAGDGNDLIWGGAGTDTINAGAGDDTVFISSGPDTVSLGSGEDTIVIDPTYLTPGEGGASMTVTDFQIADNDHFDVSNLTGHVAEITSSSTSGDLILTIADANHAGDSITITLQGVMPASHADVAQSIDISSTGDEINHLIQHIISTGGEHTT
ncbi:VCBS domain-containing protein [uncultured Pseudodesulfovibrio sp.]|uniref:calcium-binding protein n=1 Tax=uncultured Pseudodesulfovibrio sp. TaxID=2035858 RepID=UPI0029C75E82|nr:VCBS domain-containing protein [uncultured Pseudodesulfovibrio sp.]